MRHEQADTIRHLYTDPAEYIDSNHPAVGDFAKATARANRRRTARDCANMLGGDLSGRDMEREAAEG